MVRLREAVRKPSRLAMKRITEDGYSLSNLFIAIS